MQTFRFPECYKRCNSGLDGCVGFALLGQGTCFICEENRIDGVNLTSLTDFANESPKFMVVEEYMRRLGITGKGVGRKFEKMTRLIEYKILAMFLSVFVY